MTLYVIVLGPACTSFTVSYKTKSDPRDSVSILKPVLFAFIIIFLLSEP